MTINDFTITIIPFENRQSFNDVYRPVVATRADGFTLQFPTLTECEKALVRAASEDYQRPYKGHWRMK